MGSAHNTLSQMLLPLHAHPQLQCGVPPMGSKPSWTDSAWVRTTGCSPLGTDCSSMADPFTGYSSWQKTCSTFAIIYPQSMIFKQPPTSISQIDLHHIDLHLTSSQWGPARCGRHSSFCVRKSSLILLEAVLKTAGDNQMSSNLKTFFFLVGGAGNNFAFFSVSCAGTSQRLETELGCLQVWS